MSTTDSQLTSYLVESAGRSDTGLVRRNNEDAWARQCQKNFFIVADGIGGRNAGEIAAQQTVQQMCSLVQKAPINPNLSKKTTRESLRSMIAQTNQTICEMGQQNEFLHSMGSTLCCAWLIGGFCCCAHLGDSRIYLLRQGKLTQLTQDHTNGKKHHITRAIGIQQEVNPEIAFFNLEMDDLLLLCSDGITNLLSDHTIQGILNQHRQSPSLCAGALVETSIKNGGIDNSTALVVHIFKTN